MLETDADIRATGPGATPLPMQILLADDHPLFRDALRRVLSQILPQAQMHETETVSGLLDLSSRVPDADLLLLDLNMPGAHGFSALAHMRASHPALPVIVVSAHDDPTLMRRALAHGAAGFVPKSADRAMLNDAIRAVLDGETWLPPGVAHTPLALDPEEATLAARIAELTPQQYRVLGMVCSGLLNKQIGYELGVSEATIKAHMTAILRKLGAHSRTQAALLAARLTIDGSVPGIAPDED